MLSILILYDFASKLIEAINEACTIQPNLLSYNEKIYAAEKIPNSWNL